MSKQRLCVVPVLIMVLALASSAFAATTLKELNRSPFYRAGVSSEADLRKLVKDRSAELQAGFALAGQPDLYPVFMEQFPSARIAPVKVSPGETFAWMLFKRKKSGRVAVLKDVTWAGAAPFEAYRFEIDKEGKRYEFLVPAVCGNVTLRGIAMIPPPPVAAPAPPPPPPAPVAAPAPPAPVQAPAPPPVAPAPKVAVAPPPPPPPPAPAPPPVAAPPKVAAAPPPAPAPVAAPAPPPVAKTHGGPLVDLGLSRQSDPANYAFARVGYEYPLTGKLYLQGFVGGYLRWMGNDGGSAFTADAMLDYHWWNKFSFGLGAGYWSGNDGQVDLLANAGYLLSGTPEGRNTSLFLEARLPADDLEDSGKYGRFGLGVRFRL